MYRNQVNGDFTGDLTGDGLVDVRDLLLGQQAINGEKILSADQLRRGDVAPIMSGVQAPNSIFDIADMLVIHRIIYGDVTL